MIAAAHKPAEAGLTDLDPTVFFVVNHCSKQKCFFFRIKQDKWNKVKQQNDAHLKTSRLVSFCLGGDFFNAEWPVAFICIRKKVLVHLLLCRMKSSSSQGAGGSEKMWRNNGALHIIQDDMGASQTCDGDVTFILPRAPSLAVIFTHFHPRVPFARHYWLQLWFSGKSLESLMTEKRREMMDSVQKKKKKRKERSLACRAR